MKRENKPNMEGSHRWAMVLAGGDGTRLLSLTRLLAGDERPKQFCALVGNETLLQQTTRRIACLVGSEHTLVVVTKKHKQFIEAQTPELSSLAIVQPENRGTAPAILYSLLSLRKKDPCARVALFPSDHYFTDDAVFLRSVRSAFEAIEQRSDLAVLIGIVPDHPEVDYGWIQPAESLPRVLGGSLFRVDRFWEKPTLKLAENLFARRCLWNSFVIVGSADTLLRLTLEAVPGLYKSFECVRPALGTSAELHTVTELYSHLSPLDFSEQVLSVHPEDLSVLPVFDSGWVDLGHPVRVLTALRGMGGQACVASG
jgi:mannose-1-phosphate guanylyltransferase